MKKKKIGKTGIVFFIISILFISPSMIVTAETELMPYNKECDNEDQIISPIQIELTSSNLEISQTTISPQSQPLPKKYAVITVGRYFGLWKWSFLLNMTVFLDIVQQYYTWYLNDAAEMYKTLHDVYGYDHDDIFLLVKKLPENINYAGKTYFTAPDTFDDSWNDYKNISGDGIEEKLENILNKFKPDGENELTENDQLFICFIDHGGNENENYIKGIYNDNTGEYLYEFIPPTTHGNTDWFLEGNARDFESGKQGSSVTFNTQTYALYSRVTQYHSDDLVLKTNELKNVKGFRINAKKDENLYKMDIKFYNGNSEVKTVTLDAWPDNGYKYVEFENETIQADKVKISFYENDPNWGFAVHNAKVYDFNFWEADKCGGEVGRTYYGCPFTSIPTILTYLFGYDTEKLYDYELRYYTSGIEAKIIFALQPCMSGGFIYELSASNRIICTASRGCETAYASWIGCFRNALKKYDEDNNGIPDADYNNDTKISIQEAYRYAAEKVEYQLNNNPDLPPQHPLIDDTGDRIGHHFYETNYYDPTDPDKDGYSAANTFL